MRQSVSKHFLNVINSMALIDKSKFANRKAIIQAKYTSTYIDMCNVEDVNTIFADTTKGKSIEKAIAEVAHIASSTIYSESLDILRQLYKGERFPNLYEHLTISLIIKEALNHFLGEEYPKTSDYYKTSCRAAISAGRMDLRLLLGHDIDNQNADQLKKKYGINTEDLSTQTNEILFEIFYDTRRERFIEPLVKIITNIFKQKGSDQGEVYRQLYPDRYISFQRWNKTGPSIRYSTDYRPGPIEEELKDVELSIKTLKSLAKKIAEQVSVFHEITKSRDPLHKAIEEAYELRSIDSEYLCHCCKRGWSYINFFDHGVDIERLISNLTDLTMEQVTAATKEYNSTLSNHSNCDRCSLHFERTYSIHTSPDCEPQVTIEEGGIQLKGEQPKGYLDAMHRLICKLFLFLWERDDIYLRGEIRSGEYKGAGLVFADLIGKFHMTSHFEVISSTPHRDWSSSSNSEGYTLTVKEVILATEYI